MIVFPNAKINLGLHVLEKRQDGFHNIESVLYPVPLFDVIEIARSNHFSLKVHGLETDSLSKENLIYRAWDLISEFNTLEPLEVHLLKSIPLKSGLGGGSSDAVFFLQMINSFFNLGIKRETLRELSLKLGSDCPYFIKNGAQLIQGRGETLKPVRLSLKGKWLVLIFPKIGIETKNAFTWVIPTKNSESIAKIIEEPIETWKKELKNDFESPVFKRYSKLEYLKAELYNSGAIFASLSGSGSTLFGIFNNEPILNAKIKNEDYWKGLFSN